MSRFDSYMKFKGLNDNQVTVECKLSQGLLGQARTGKSDLGNSTINKILSIYQDLNRVWLLTGEGDMLIPLRKSTFEPEISYTDGRPYFDVDFIGGFDLVADDQTTKPEYLIDFKPYNDVDCWCNVTGHSMEPEINHGDIIALKELNDWQTFVPSGVICAIVTTEHRTIKKVVPSEREGYWKLIPSNKSPEYVAQEIPKGIVRRVFLVKGCLKRF